MLINTMRQFKLLTFSVLFCLLAGGVVLGQGVSVSGRVIDEENNEPVVGASILIKGSSVGTIADFNGAFSIDASIGDVLVISFVGYTTQEVTVADGVTDYPVTLSSDTEQLAELLVIGYGLVEAEDVTGAISSIRAEDFNGGIIASPEQLFQGKAAGVQITSNSGEPGAGISIRIRGTASVRTGSNPLFVIDGVPLSGADSAQGGPDLGRSSSTAKNPLNFLNPADIASIDILKDASATAIYGSRGSNGVVLITTKDGRGSSGALTYTGSVSLSTPGKRYDLLSTEEFLKEAGSGGGAANKLNSNNDTDWQEEVLANALSTTHNVSYGMGYSSGDVRGSLGYTSLKGVMKQTGLNRITGRINWNQQFLSDKLKLGVRGTFSQVDDNATLVTDMVGFRGDIIGVMLIANPTWSSDPTVQPIGDVQSPTSFLEYYGDSTKTSRIFGGATLGYDVNDFLNAKVVYGYDKSDSSRGLGFSKLFESVGSGIPGNGKAGIRDKELLSHLVEAYLTFDKEFGSVDVNVVGGYSAQTFVEKGVDIVGFGFDEEEVSDMVDELRDAYDDVVADKQLTGLEGVYLQQIAANADDLAVGVLGDEGAVTREDLAAPTDFGVESLTANNFEFEDIIQSVFGRVNLSILDKYLITGTIRVDGSSKFGPDNRYGSFPSGAVAWRLSNESFFPDFFDDFKVRIGYGITGNQAIPHNLYQTRQNISGPDIDNVGFAQLGQASDVAFANGELGWEQTSQLNAGLDLAILKGKMSLSFDYYYKNSTDILIKVFAAQPASNAFIWRNLDAEVINKGIELTVNYSNLIDAGDFQMDLGFNIGTNDNEITNYTGPQLETGTIDGQGLTGAFSQLISDGQPLYAYYLREFGGYNADGFTEYVGGDFQKFLDGKAPLPKLNGGASLAFRFRSLAFNLSFAGQYGHYIYNNTANALFTAGSLANGRNVTADVPGSGENPQNAPESSSRFLEKGDFTRLQSATLSYTFPNAIGPIEFLNLYLNGQNLFVITEYSGQDPEFNVNKALNDVPSLGIDYLTYPRGKTFSFGLVARFSN